MWCCKRGRKGNLKRAQDLLRAHIPKAGERDLRGFEWRYLWNLCQDESRYALTNFDHALGGLAFSLDGKFLAVGAGQAVKLLDINSRRELGEGCVMETPMTPFTALPFRPRARTSWPRPGSLE